MKKKINIYYGNHGKRDGVEDIIVIIKNIFEKRDFEISISPELNKECINIIIDEFTNYICNEDIIQFKTKNKNTIIVFVLTEFIESKLLIHSFNFFGGIMMAAPIAAMNIFFRKHRKDFLPAKFKDWMIAAIYSPLMALYLLYHWFSRIKNKEKISLSARLHSVAYMHMRYLGLERMIEYADYLILSHALIEDNLRKFSPDCTVIGTLCPEIDFEDIKNNLFIGKQLQIEITGSITPYRQTFIEKINADIILLGLKNVFNLCQTISFSNKSNVTTRGAFSLHPPQTEKWKYSSPTRIYRALQYDHNIPILTKVFHQHPIEDLCLTLSGAETLIQIYKFYKKPNLIISVLEERVKKYMVEADSQNDQIIKNLIYFDSKSDNNV